MPSDHNSYCRLIVIQVSILLHNFLFHPQQLNWVVRDSHKDSAKALWYEGSPQRCHDWDQRVRFTRKTLHLVEEQSKSEADDSIGGWLQVQIIDQINNRGFRSACISP